MFITKRHIILSVFLCQSLTAQIASKLPIYPFGYIDFSDSTTKFIRNTGFNYLRGRLMGFIDSGFQLQNEHSFLDYSSSYMLANLEVDSFNIYSDRTGIYNSKNELLYQSGTRNKWRTSILSPSLPDGVPYMDSAYIEKRLNNRGNNFCVKFTDNSEFGACFWDEFQKQIIALQIHHKNEYTKIDTLYSLNELSQYFSVTCGPIPGSYWIVGLSIDREKFLSYLWKKSGIDTCISSPITDPTIWQLYTKSPIFSPNNKYMFCLKANNNRFIYTTNGNSADQFIQHYYTDSTYDSLSRMYEFDQSSGILKLLLKIPIQGINAVFSANSKFIYTTGFPSDKEFGQGNEPTVKLRKYNIFGQFLNSYTSKKHYNYDWFNPSELKLLPNGNIYHGVNYKDASNSSNVFDRKVDIFLNTINNNYESDLDTSISFSNLSILETANFDEFNQIVHETRGWINYLSCKCLEQELNLEIPRKHCLTDTLVLGIPYSLHDSILINWGDGEKDVIYPSQKDAKHKYHNAGNYSIKLLYISPFTSFDQHINLTLIKPAERPIIRDSSICMGEDIHLFLTDSLWFWKMNGKQEIHIQNQDYYLFCYSDSICGNQKDSIFVDVLPVPKIHLPDTLLCPENVLNINIPQEVSNIIWDGNPLDTSHFKQFNQNGTHTLQYSNQYCSRIDTFEIAISETPKIEVFQRNPDACYQYEPLIFDLSIKDSTNNLIKWPEYTPYLSTYLTQNIDTFRFSIINQDACLSEYQVSPKYYCKPEIYIPNTFTPDQNGPPENETFAPIIEDGKLKYLKIFNRWGEMIYSGVEPWDGTYQGKLVPNGVYAYVIGVEISFGTQKSLQHFKGSVQVLR